MPMDCGCLRSWRRFLIASMSAWAAIQRIRCQPAGFRPADPFVELESVARPLVPVPDGGVYWASRDTAWAMTSASSTKPPKASNPMRDLARAESGMVSVGLKAMELDSEKYT